MSIIAPIFKGATGGLADDIFVGVNDSFQDSRNLEIRKNPRGITLSKKLSKDSGTVVDALIKMFIKLSNGIIVGFGVGGGTFIKESGVWIKNPYYSSFEVTNVIEFQGYLYVSSSIRLYRVSIGSVSGGFQLFPFHTYTGSGVPYHPFLAISTFLYIGNGTSVDRIGESLIYEDTLLKINPLGSIIKLQMQGVNIKIYSQEQNRMLVYYWNGGDNAISEYIPYEGVVIEQLLNKDGNDYVISNGDLQVIDGYKMTQVKCLDNYTPYSTSNNCMIVKDSSLLFGCTGGIFEWGGLNKNYPDVLSYTWITSNATTDIIGALLFDGTDLYVSRSNAGGTVFGIDKLSTSYNSTGYLTSRVYYSDYKTQKKASLGIDSCFAKLSTGDSIKIYYKEDLQGSFTLLDTITSTSEKTTDFSNKVNLSGDWNMIEFKIELNSGSGSTTPEFYELYFKFDNVDG